MKRNLATDRGLTPQQQQAVLLLSLGLNISEVAAKLNVSRTTLANWFKLPEVVAEFDRINEQLYRAGVIKLTGAFERTIDRLITIIDDDSLRPSDHIKAASIILRAIDNYQLAAIQTRLQQLEDAI